MVLSSSKLASLAVAAAIVATGANGHGVMLEPYPTWPVGYYINYPMGLIQGDTYLPVPDGMSYGGDPLSNTEAYWTAFNASTYTSLKDLVTQTEELQSQSVFGTATKECGFSLANGTARDLPASVEWTGFGDSHHGPCEVWCDDTLVFEDSDCAEHYTTDPAVLPYDSAKCEGASMLTSYWIALHGLPWQVYTNCAPLTGALNTTSSSSTTTAPTTTTTAPTTTTAAPATTTTAPATTTAAPAATTAAPATTTAAPATTTAAPAATTAAPAATTAAPEASAASDEDEYADSASESAAGEYDEETEAPAAETEAPATETEAPAATTAADKCTASVRRRRRD
jgi:hypothetical protein